MSKGNLAVDIYNPVALRKAGLEALARELGSLGMVAFLRQYEPGEGDYTRDRAQWLDELTSDKIIEELKAKMLK